MSVQRLMLFGVSHYLVHLNLKSINFPTLQR